MCKIFPVFKKKATTYSFSGNAHFDGRNICSEVIFFASKLGEKETHERVNLAGLHGIYYTASSARATVSGMHLWDLYLCELNFLT